MSKRNINRRRTSHVKAADCFPSEKGSSTNTKKNEVDRKVKEVGNDDDDGKRKSSRHRQTSVKSRGTKKTKKRESERILKVSTKCEECGKTLYGRKQLRLHVLHNENRPAEVGGDGKRNSPRVSSATATAKVFSPKMSLGGKGKRVDGLPRTNKLKSGSSRSPVKCLIEGCSRVLSKRSHLYRHMRNVHKIDPKKFFKDQENGPAEVVGGVGETSSVRLRLFTTTQTAGSSQSRTSVVRRKDEKSLNSTPCCIPAKCSMEGCDQVLSRRCHLFRHLRNVQKVEPLKFRKRPASRSRNGKRNDATDSSSKKKNTDRKSTAKAAPRSRNRVKCPIITCGLWVARIYYFRHIKNTHGRTGGIPTDDVDQTILQRVIDSGNEKTRAAVKKVVSFVTRPFESTAKTRWATICPPQPKIFPCPIEICDKKFSRQEHRLNHIENVHKVDPYRLTMADGKPFAVKKFRRSYPFFSKGSRSSVKCPFELCGKTLSRRHNLIVHLKNVHKTDPWNTFDMRQKLMGMQTSTHATMKSTRGRKSEEVKNISTSDGESDS